MDDLRVAHGVWQVAIPATSSRPNALSKGKVEGIGLARPALS
jgi:hypothetical protein